MANSLVEEIVGGQETQEPAQDAATTPKPWNRERAPTQVQLLELLQFVSGRDYFECVEYLAVSEDYLFSQINVSQHSDVSMLNRQREALIVARAD